MKFCLPIIICFLSLISYGQTSNWKPTPTPIETKWAKDITPENVWKEYPRPQMTRKAWQNLNGLWDYTVTSNTVKEKPANWLGKILVPFSIEAPLSGVGKQIDTKEAIWYKRFINIPKNWSDKKVLIHFEASDFETTVWLDGKLIGHHKGGYQPFSFAINAVQINSKSELIVKVNDPKGDFYHSYGKQDNKTRAYESCSGIWQTVWMEPVSKTASIDNIKIQADLKKVSVFPNIIGSASGLKVKYEILDGGRVLKSVTIDANQTLNAEIPNPKLWSPDSPFLYDLKVTLYKGTEVLDQVESYFGMRTIEYQQAAGGANILLNGKPIFQYGPLDQNYWPDGGLTPPSDAAMEWEAKYLKQIGCNMVRSHIKQNNSRYYYHCDKLGLLVWQDFICGKFNGKIERAQSDFWFNEQKEMIASLYNHPSIVMWIIFNEAWGQHDTERVYEQVKPLDNTRILSIASGWDDYPNLGQVRDIHDYTFSPSITAPGEDKRVVILGEAGGFASAVQEHNWLHRANVEGITKNPLHGGFNPDVPSDDNLTHDIFRPTFTAGIPFQKQYKGFIDRLRLLQNSGLRAVVYTEMTDMKMEENGFLTFDRKVSKMDPDSLGAIHKTLYQIPPSQTVILNKDNAVWEMSNVPIQEITDRAKNEKMLDAMAVQTPLDFNKIEWRKGKAPFGNFPGDKIGSNWDVKSQLVIKSDIDIQDLNKQYTARIYTKLNGGKGKAWIHTRIYVNGVFVADETTRQSKPELRVAELILPKSLMDGVLKKGKNTIVAQFISGFLIVPGKIIDAQDGILVNVEITEVD